MSDITLQSSTGTFTGNEQEYSYEYKIFVHKNDYDKGIGMIR